MAIVDLGRSKHSGQFGPSSTFGEAIWAPQIFYQKNGTLTSIRPTQQAYLVSLESKMGRRLRYAAEYLGVAAHPWARSRWSQICAKIHLARGELFEDPGTILGHQDKQWSLVNVARDPFAAFTKKAGFVQAR